MAQKAKMATNNGGAYPPEAYEFNDEVSLDTVEEVRKKIGVDFGNGDWKVIDGLGQVVPA